MTPEQEAELKQVLTTSNSGIETFFQHDADFDEVAARITAIANEPLSKVQLDQLLGLQKERAVSDDFFKYYWCSEPRVSYELNHIPGYDKAYDGQTAINSVAHLLYGLYRVFVDGLLYCGNVRAYYRENCNKTIRELQEFHASQYFDTTAIKGRGPILKLRPISRDDKYLISEMACKSYGDVVGEGQLKEALIAAWHSHVSEGGGGVPIGALLKDSLTKTKYASQQDMFIVSSDDILEEAVNSVEDIEKKYQKVAEKFTQARTAAIHNTKLYLSLVNDLDVYVATSMRTRDDFRNMADTCDQIFSDSRLAEMHLRYFDPTMSAADGHQDKGLIECLMVKCAKVLVYCAGKKESYGKDAEAAMALSLGKPVIFLCEEETKQQFYREVHPLSRLINFGTGVAVGAIVTSKVQDVSELLYRIFSNRMQYRLHQPKGRKGYLQVQEVLTDSVVRLQTNDKLLSEAFWNYYRTH